MLNRKNNSTTPLTGSKYATIIIGNRVEYLLVLRTTGPRYHFRHQVYSSTYARVYVRGKQFNTTPSSYAYMYIIVLRMYPWYILCTYVRVFYKYPAVRCSACWFRLWVYSGEGIKARAIVEDDVTVPTFDDAGSVPEVRSR